MRYFGAGIIEDIRGRIPHYLSDWADGLSPKALSAGIFIFFSQAIPATVFAAYLSARTEGQLGVAEVLLSMGLGGALFALLAGQPLVIVGVTGPVCILLATTAELAARWGLPLRGWLLAACLWATLFHAVLALVSAPRAFSRAVTAFSGDVFGALIGLIYVVEGATVLLEPLALHSSSTAVLALCLGCACAGLAGALSCSRAWSPLARVNGLLEDYALPLAVVLSTLLSRAPAWADAARNLPLLPVGSSGSSIGNGILNALGTASALPAWAAAAAALPGGMLTALLFFDHNISAMLCQAPRFALCKPPSYDWDFLLLGLSVTLTGVLGLPPNYGLLPQAPMHTAALATFADASSGGSGEAPAVTAVCENRVSAALQSALLLALLAPPLLQGALGAVPLGVLGGLLVFLGLAGLAGNGAVSRWARIAASWTGGCRRVQQQQQQQQQQPPPPSYAALALGASQLLLVGAIYGLTRTPVGLLFPALILALPPLRARVLPWALGRSEVEAEDPADWGRGAAAGSEGEDGDRRGGGMEAASPEAHKTAL